MTAPRPKPKTTPEQIPPPGAATFPAPSTVDGGIEPPPTGESSSPAADPFKIPGADSARAILESLAQDRGTRLLPEEDYQEMRSAILQELADGPRLRGSMLVTFAAVGLLLLAFLGIGVAMALRHGPAEVVLIGAATVSLGFWGWLLRQYLVSVRDQARMSIRARLAELEELRGHQLISQAEYETIFAAIHMTRGAPPA